MRAEGIIAILPIVSMPKNWSVLAAFRSPLWLARRVSKMKHDASL